MHNMTELSFRFRLPLTEAPWAPNTAVYIGPDHVCFWDGSFLEADTYAAVRAAMLSFSLHGVVEEYVPGSEEDHVVAPPPAPEPEADPGHWVNEG